MTCRINSLFDEYQVGVGDLITRKLHVKDDPLLDCVETAAEATARGARIIGQLFRCADPNAYELASTLQSCSGDRPCGSGVCQPCDLASREVLIPTADNVLGRDLPLTRIRLEPRAWRNSIGALTNVDLRRFASSHEWVFKKALPDITTIGVFDVALSGWDRGKGEWQFGITLIAEVANTRELRDTLRRCFPGDPAWAPQHRFRQVSQDDRLREVCDLLRPLLGESTRPYGAGGFVETMADLAPASAALEAVLCLHRFPIHKRLILNRISRVGGRDGLNLKRLYPRST